MRIKWNAAISGSFDTCNGVKERGVLSSLLFNVYLDELILLIREQGVRCHMNDMSISVEFVNSVDSLGVPLYEDLKVDNIHSNIQNFYCKVNSVLFDFKDIPSDVESKPIDTYCLYKRLFQTLGPYVIKK